MASSVPSASTAVLLYDPTLPHIRLRAHLELEAVINQAHRHLQQATPQAAQPPLPNQQPLAARRVLCFSPIVVIENREGQLVEKEALLIREITMIGNRIIAGRDVIQFLAERPL